ncbi:MAG TPA: hypothetical protein VEA80_17280 [Vitreimonas sp.]|uniref:hypothetical protein n=1 Tax=Vitreimonas sp. TaxID=3069702 RepID=UPI002D4B4945|nr:hypothetical protein [Vitreimonas sp.]HYD89235.1 hypothetical protein [Vitreimonas sp.]
MHRSMRVFALALVLAATPACASLPVGGTRIENPVAAARTLDQRAYALTQSYAAILEEAADIVRDPATPAEARAALARAEAAATPVVEALHGALAAYRAARTSAAQSRLERAVASAAPAVAELQSLVRSNR